LCLSLWAGAETITTTVVAWDSVSIGGDAGVTASYLNSAKSMGQVTKDHSATLNLSGLPAGTIQSVTLYVRSNKTSGSAMVMMSLGEHTWLVANGAYSTWPGMNVYSTTDQPLSCIRQPQTIHRGANLKLQIVGLANSVYWSKLEISYTPAPPVPHTVTLHWMSPDGEQTKQLMEASAGDGITLPSVPGQDSIIPYESENWYWQGWCEQPIFRQSSSPLCWQTDDWYGPKDDCTLYALYTNTPVQSIVPDSSWRSGEYAIVRIEEIDILPYPMVYALSGAWKSGQISMHKIDLFQNQQKQWVWKLTTLSDDYRYQLTYKDDSVSIYHSKSGKWIGYASSSGSSDKSFWSCQHASNGTVALCGNQPNYVMSINFNQSYDLYAFYANEPIRLDYPNWYLFPLSSVPSQADTQYTTFLGTTPNSSLMVKPTPCTKFFNQQGQICIQYNHIKYNLLGQPL